MSSSRRYSPQSACLNTTIPVGSSLLPSAVERAVTPNPCVFISDLVSCVRRHSRASTYKRSIVHAQNHDTLVLRAVLAPAANVCLHNVSAVQEGHLAVRLDPDLVPSVGRNNVQRGDVHPELSGLGELSETRPERKKALTGDRGSEVG